MTATVEAAKFTHRLARASPGRKSYSAVRSRQAAANRMILWPVPSTRAQPTRAEPLSVQSIKQPQLDLHSGSTTRHLSGEGPRPITSCHGLGGRSRQTTSMVASHPSNADEHAGRSSVKAGLTPKAEAAGRERRVRLSSSDALCAPTRGELRRGDVDALADMTGHSPPSSAD